MDSARVRVELQLNWFPEAEHGGYYAALVHGDYAEEGLDVSIRPGGPGVPVLAQVASKRVMFGIASAHQVLLGWAQEARTVAILAPLQDSPRCIMVHEGSGIREFNDLHDITLAMNSSSPFSLYLQKKLPLNNVRIVPYAGNVAQFLLQEDYAQQAYSFSEPYVARRQGGDPDTLMVSELGFNPYTSVLITHPDTIREQPDLVRRMVAAAIRGWQHYLTDSDATNRYIGRQNDEMEIEILAFGAHELAGLCLPANLAPQDLGRMSPDRWQTLHDQLVEVEALETGTVDPSRAYTTIFLDPIPADHGVANEPPPSRGVADE